MPTLNEPRVLFVEDDEDACEMLSVLMRSCGIAATCAISASEAWQLIREECFDLFVLDGWLPGIDGYEFCRQIREVDSDTPILFYSGAAYDTDKQMGIAAGANAYVVKPDIEGLIQTIAELMPEVSLRIANSRAVVKDPLPVEIRFVKGFFGWENERLREVSETSHAKRRAAETDVLSSEYLRAAGTSCD